MAPGSYGAKAKGTKCAAQCVELLGDKRSKKKQLVIFCVIICYNGLTMVNPT